MTAGRRDALGLCAVLGFAALVLGHGLDLGAKVDVASVGGDRVLRGDAPYRDFWTIYSPGSFYAVAGLFRVFERDLAVVHAASALLAALAGLAFFSLLRRAGLRTLGATLASIAFLVAIWTPAPGLHSYVMPRLLLLVGWERAVAALAQERRSPLFAAGLAFGFAAWFKHDVAAYAALGSGVAVGLWRLRARPLRESVADVLALGLSALVPVLPAVVFVAVIGGVAAWNDLIAFPLADFRVVRGEAYPGPVPEVGRLLAALGDPENPLRLRRAVSLLSDWARAWLPALGLGTAVAGLGVARLASHAAPVEADTSARDAGGGVELRASRAAIAVALSCAPFFWMAAHVQQNTHVFSLGILAALALAGAGRGLARRPAIGVAGMGVLLALGFAIGPARSFVQMQRAAPGARLLAVPGASGALVSQAEYATLRPIIDFVADNVPSDEAIYVGLKRHDAILVGEASLYFLAGRAAATRYHELHPGVSDREDVQREMLGEIEAAGVRCVILWSPGLPDSRLDAILAARRRELPELGARLLDEGLASNFDEVASYGAYDVLWRRGTPRPWEAVR